MSQNQEVHLSSSCATVHEGDDDVKKMKELIRCLGLSQFQVWSNGYMLLRDAVENKHTDIVRVLLCHCEVNLNGRVPCYTPFYSAAINGDEEAITLLMSNKSDINAVDDKGWSSLHHAVQKNQLKIVNFLLSHGALIDLAERTENMMPIHVAAKYHSSLVIVARLLKSGASLSRISKTGYTPLHFAVESNNDSLAIFLLSENADPNFSANDNITPLHIAARKGYHVLVQILLRYGADINEEDATGKTSLFLSVENNHFKVAKTLLRKNAVVDSENYENITPLCVALKYKFSDVAELLVEYKANIYVEDSDGNNVMHLAAESGNYNLVCLLLGNDALLDTKNKDNKTPLLIAVEQGHDKIAKVLLKNTADPTFRDVDQKKILDLAVIKGCILTVKHILLNCAKINYKSYANIFFLLVQGSGKAYNDIAEILIKHGFSLSAENIKDVKFLRNAVEKGHLKIVTELLKKGVNVNTTLKLRNISGSFCMPLHVAVKNQLEDMVNLLLAHGADVNSQDGDGRTPLFYAVNVVNSKIARILLAHKASLQSNSNLLLTAAQNKCEGLLEILLQNGADVRSTDEDGRTALHYSVFTFNDQCNLISNKEALVKLLLSYGADVNAEDSYKKTPLFYAVKDANVKIIDLLFKNKARITSNLELLKAAVLSKRCDVVETLLDHGVDINEKDSHGRTVLHYIIFINGKDFGSMWDRAHDNIEGEIARLLLRRGADVNAEYLNGMTILFIAVDQGCSRVVKVLTDFNANVNHKNHDGVAPLHVASHYGNEDIVKILLSRGANIDATQNDKTTSLHIAVSANHVGTVQLLLNLGANANAKSMAGATPLHIAAEEGSVEIINVLLEFGANIDAIDENNKTAIHFAAQKSHPKVVQLLVDHWCDINFITKCGQSPLDLALEYNFSLYYNQGNIHLRLRETIVKLQHHIVKLKSANLFVNEIMLRLVSDEPELVSFQSNCEKEIECMKHEKIGESCASYFDVLTKSSKQLAALLRRKDVVCTFKSEMFKTEFPIYANLLERQFVNGEKRKNLLENCNAYFLLNFTPDLPQICTEIICDYLSNEDLKMFLEALHPTKVSWPSTEKKYYCKSVKCWYL